MAVLPQKPAAIGSPMPTPAAAAVDSESDELAGSWASRCHWQRSMIAGPRRTRSRPATRGHHRPGPAPGPATQAAVPVAGVHASGALTWLDCSTVL
jgi:hypothetical protein